MILTKWICAILLANLTERCLTIPLLYLWKFLKIFHISYFYNNAPVACLKIMIWYEEQQHSKHCEGIAPNMHLFIQIKWGCISHEPAQAWGALLDIWKIFVRFERVLLQHPCSSCHSSKVLDACSGFYAFQCQSSYRLRDGVGLTGMVHQWPRFTSSKTSIQFIRLGEGEDKLNFWCFYQAKYNSANLLLMHLLHHNASYQEASNLWRVLQSC